MIAALGGCGEPPATPNSETDPISLFPEPPTAVAVGGTVEVFPPVGAWSASLGREDPALPGGLSLQFTEPLRLALGDPTGALGATDVHGDGSFAADVVAIDDLVVGLGAMLDPAPALSAVGLEAAATTLIYDSRHVGMDPRLPLDDARVYALPSAWLDDLGTALGTAALLTRAPGAGSIREAGYLVGQVVDAEGVPVAGARLVLEPPALEDGLWYPDGALRSSGGDATGPEGLFLLVHDGEDVQSFSFTLEGAAPAPPYRGVLARERGLLLRVGVPP